MNEMVPAVHGMLPGMAPRQISNQAAESLRTRILDGTYPPGSRLPGERALSAELGLSRTALRDALRSLEAGGFVEVRGATGRFVTETKERESSAAALDWLLLHRDDLESLNEVRELLEPAAVASMTLADAPRIAKRLARIVDDQMSAVVRGQLHVAADLDGEFHSVLVEASTNAPLRELTWQLISMAKVLATRVYSVQGVAAQSIMHHQDIVAALAEGQIDAAASLVGAHVRNASRAAFLDGHSGAGDA